MSALKRLRRLVKASINDALDNLEDPVTMANQLIRDMEQAILQARREVAAATTELNLLRQKSAAASEEVSTWTDNAKLAVQQGKDDLARQALLRKRAAQDSKNSLDKAADEQVSHIDELTEQLKRLEDKIQEARRKRDMIIARERQSAKKPSSGIIDGFDDLTRFDDRANRQAATAPEPDIEEEFRRLREQNAIDAELDKLKKRMS